MSKHPHNFVATPYDHQGSAHTDVLIHCTKCGENNQAYIESVVASSWKPAPCPYPDDPKVEAANV